MNAAQTKINCCIQCSSLQPMFQGAPSDSHMHLLTCIYSSTSVVTLVLKGLSLQAFFSLEVTSLVVYCIASLIVSLGAKIP